MNKFTFSALLLFALGCQDRQVSDTWEIDLYTDSNNIPASAVPLPEGKGYVVLGQKFTETDSVQHACALVKLSPGGEVQKQVFFGRDNARLAKIAMNSKGVTFLTGSKDARLWIREIDHDLNVISDKVFDSIDVFDLYDPEVLFVENDLVVVLNSDSSSLEVIRMTRDYDIVWQKEFVNSFCVTDKGTSSILFKDAFLEGNSILITGDGHPFQQHGDDSFNYDTFFMQLNATTGDQQWFTTYGEGRGNFGADAIKAMKDKYYAVGTGRVGERYPDIYLYCLDKNGTLLWTKSLGGSDTDYGNDLAVYDGEIKIVGFTHSNDGIFSGNNGESDCFIASLTEEGVVLNTRVFGSSATDELEHIIRLDGEYSLVLGHSNVQTSFVGNAWKIIKMNNNTISHNDRN